MSWNRLDDDFADHPKVIEAGNSAVGCWVRCWATCGRYYTGGFVSETSAARYGSKQDHDELTEARLWSRVKSGESYTVTGRRDSGRRKLRDVTVTFPSDGFFIRDFLQYHFTREEFENGGPRSTTASNNASPNATACATAAPLEETASRGARNLPSQPIPPHPNPNPSHPKEARASRGALLSGMSAGGEGGGPRPNADPATLAEVSARLDQHGWRSKTKSSTKMPGKWERDVGTLVGQGVDLDVVDGLWRRAKRKSKGNPMDLFGHWLDPESQRWRAEWAEEQSQGKEAEARSRALAASKAAAMDVHNGDPTQ